MYNSQSTVGLQLLGAHSVHLIDYFVQPFRAGVYVLSRDGSTAHYIGRSDYDLRDRIKTSSQTQRRGRLPYTHFWYQYANNAVEAYRLECMLYHKYSPSDNDVHPASPEGTNVSCHICKK